MTVVYDGYTVGDNRPLNHARILYAPLVGAVTGDGTGAANAANDYTFQRWQAVPGPSEWVLENTPAAEADTVFIAAHNLAGRLVTIATQLNDGSGYVDRATFTPADNSTICAMFTYGDGLPVLCRRIRVTVDDGDGVAVGIIRAGVALQMAVPFYSGHAPTTLNRVTEARQQFSEAGQWLGRQIQRRAVEGSYGWKHLPRAWYGDEFEPFAQTLPLAPFGIAGNPLRMPDDVAWCWTEKDLRPTLMGVREYMQVDLAVTGYW